MANLRRGIAAFLLLTCLMVLQGVSEARAQEEPPPEPGVRNDTCLECHGESGLTQPLENGLLLDLTVTEEEYEASVHGELGYACVQCHTSLGEYPHPEFSAEDHRDVSLQLYQACERCHAAQYELVQDSVHERALAAGEREAAICTDCHPPHTMDRLEDPDTGELLPEARVSIPETCAQCHSLIYANYQESVHGSALLAEGNPDVPTCIDCHGVHNIEDPTTTFFRLKSPELCAGCHTDPDRMETYGLSTQVLDTFVADFHGSTVTLFEKQTPDQDTNKPVCFDCHGVHDIRRADDPEKGLQVRENLLARCQVCHPDATAGFPDAWLSHYIPAPDRAPLVYYVNQFYRFFIPGVLGGMAVLVVLDLGSRFRFLRRLRPGRGTVAAPDPAEEAAGQQVTRAEPTPEDQVLPSEEGPEDSPSPAESGGHESPSGQETSERDD